MFHHSMTFDLGEDVNALREAVHRFAQEQIKPRAAEIDKSNAFPPELWKALGDMGLHGLTVPEDDGGAGMGYLAHTVAIEEVARASASVSLSYGAHSNLCLNQINLNFQGLQHRHQVRWRGRGDLIRQGHHSRFNRLKALLA
ncbi:MAG: acyl-CoA dehydrogenase family protein, partial [Pseudomonadota bacterium]